MFTTFVRRSLPVSRGWRRWRRITTCPTGFGPIAGDVCVVGAGSGNDVAAALRNGASSVTAVEIDPVILRLGEQLHPERPYQDRRTQAVLNDARTFLRQSEQRFDLVVYGMLDSHTNLGAMTNVRLDSFVYTVEGFRDALGRLKDGGLLVVSYVLLDPKQGDKLYAMLNAAYPDRLPRAFGNRHGGYTFVTGPGLASLPLIIADTQEVTAHLPASRRRRRRSPPTTGPFFTCRNAPIQ